MERNRPYRMRSGDSAERSSYANLRRRNLNSNYEFVPVSGNLKGHIIGKGGCVIKEIKRESGAEITTDRDKEGFHVSGSEEQRASAKKLINQKLEEVQNGAARKSPPREHIKIPDEYKGLVIGKGGESLRRISTATGAKFIRLEGEVYVSGTDEQIRQAKFQIKVIVIQGRLRNSNQGLHKVCCYVDDWNLPENCGLGLQRTEDRERMVMHVNRHAQYRLRPLDECGPGAFCKNNDRVPAYRSKLESDVLESLYNIKHEIESKPYLRADMWCHFGSVIIREPDEDEIEEAWSIAGASEKLSPQTDDDNFWRVAFKEGVDLDENVLEKAFGEQTSEDFIARYDLTFVTPSGREMRCKVWVAKENLGKKLEEVQIPFRDVKNIVEELHFDDDATRSRCRGWLVLPSEKYFQGDILFPGCQFDCRITIRTRIDSMQAACNAPDEEERKLLSSYLSKVTFTADDLDGLHLSKDSPPDGFELIHKRCSHRTMYTPSSGFVIIHSRENSWRGNVMEEDERQSTDLHLHCEEWDQALNGEDWIPEEIADKLPEFLAFVQKVQDFVSDEIK